MKLKRVRILFSLIVMFSALISLTSCQFSKGGKDDVDSYNITFDIQEHGEQPEDIEDVTAIPVGLPVLTEEGYTFGGWYFDSECKKIAVVSAKINQDVTLYAKWTINTYVVTFITEGGSSVEAQTIEHGKLVNEPTAPVKSDYTFAGWYKDNTYTTAWNFTTDTVKEEVILYAKWVENVYTITFYPNGHGISLDQFVSQNVTSITNLPQLTEDGYTFEGWYYDADFTLKANVGDEVKSDLSLYAKWSINSTPAPTETYTVTYNVNGNGTTPSQVTGVTALPTLPVLTAAGYTFGGWYLDSECTQLATSGQEITANTTLYAKWTINTYTVTFNSLGGSTVSNQTINYGAIVTKPSDPTRTGYTFGGWYKDSAYTTVWNFTTDTISTNTTLYAKWELITYTITFNVLGHGTAPSQISGVTEIPDSLPTLSVNGYTFGGWYYNSTCTNAVEAGDSIANNITIYAKWTDADGSTSGSFETPEIPGNVVKATKTVFSNNLKKDGPLTQEAFPSTGSPKLLVVPVNLNSTEATAANIEEIKLAFDGSETETGWESVRTFYEKSSYGKLNIDVDVVEEWFTPQYSASYYESYNDTTTYDDGSILILREALAYLEGVMDLSQYDYDNDGYLDSVWLVYNAPVDFTGESDFYWAYVTWEYQTTTYDGKMACNYGFAGIDFMHEETELYPTTGFVVDAHTFIHETGHLLGLDDYYDYEESVGASGGLYSADMMDYNIGDHGMISKLLLGWVSPTVLTGSGEITLNLESFTTTGNFLLIANHTLESIYDEYFLIEFYTNDGLNANDNPVMNTTSSESIGIRIVHVDAHKYYNSQGEADYNGDEYYPTGFTYDNSGTTYKFVDMMRADYSSSMSDYATADSLFTPTSGVFGVDVYNNYTTHDGKALNFTLKVNSMTDSSCSLTITLA